MPRNGLKLNDGKTEYLCLHSKNLQAPSSIPINIGNDTISPSPQAKNLGVIFDDTLSLRPHIAAICKSAFFQLRKISCIRRFLTSAATKTLVHSFVSSHLGYCNGVLCGIPDSDVNKLQCVQNVAARLITHTRKFDHITPVLQELHWLPVRTRILYKILVLTYKALNGTAPDYIRSLLTCYQPKRALCSAGKGSLVVPLRTQFHMVPGPFHTLPPSISTSCLKMYPNPHTCHF